MSEKKLEETVTKQKSPETDSVADELHILLDRNQQLLKKYESLAADVSDRFNNEVGKDLAKKYVEMGQKCKATNPSQFEAAKQQFELEMSSFVANNRLLDQKPLNRKGVSKRTWV